MKGICLTVNLIPRLVVYDKYQLRYDWICMYTLPVRIAQQGCHGNHAFSHSPNEFMFRNIFSHSREPRKQFGTSENCHGVQSRSNWILWYRVPHFSANLRNCLPQGIPSRIAFLCTSSFFLRI